MILVKRVFLSLIFLLAVSRFSAAQGIIQLTDGLSHLFRPATISGDGSKIFYFRYTRASDGWAKTGNLYMRDVNSSVPEILAENIRIDYWLISNHDGSRLIFGAYENLSLANAAAACFQLYSLDVTQKKLTKLANLCPSQAQAVLAEEAQTFVLASFRGVPGTGIFLTKLDGTEPKRIATDETVTIATDPKAQFVYFYRYPKGIVRLDVEGGEQTQVVTLPENYDVIRRIFVTPDDSRLYFVTENGGRYQTFIYTRATGTTEAFLAENNTRLLSVSGDGQRLLLETAADLTGENSDHVPQLFIVSADGSARKQLTRLKRGQTLYSYYDYLAKLSDTGDRVMILSSRRLPQPTFGDSGEWLYHIDSKTGEFKLMDFSMGQYKQAPIPVAGGSQLLFLSNVDGTAEPQLLLSQSDGLGYRQLTNFDMTGVQGVTASADAGVLAFIRRTDEGGDVVKRIWVYRTRERDLLQVAEVRDRYRLLNDPGPPVYGLSMDGSGEILVFSTYKKLRNKDPDGLASYLYIARLHKDGAELEFLAPGLTTGISANGRLIAFESRSEVSGAGAGLFVLRPDGSGLTRIGSGFAPQISADGEWIASLRAHQIILSRTDGTFERQLGSSGLLFASARISADGQTVVGLAFKDWESPFRFFVAYARNGTELARVTVPSADIYDWTLHPAGTRAYFVSSAKIANNQDGSQEIFTALLAPPSYWAPKLAETENSFAGLAVANLNSVPAEVLITAHDGSGSLITGPAVQNPTSQSLLPGQQISLLLPELFGTGVVNRTVTVEISSKLNVNSFFLTGSSSLDRLQGSTASDAFASHWIFPLSDSIFQSAATEVTSSLVLVNPHAEQVSAEIKLDYPILPRSKNLLVPALGTVAIDVGQELLTPLRPSFKPLLEVSSPQTLRAELRITRKSGSGASGVIIPGLQPFSIPNSLIFPHVAVGESLQTRIWLVNPETQPAEIEIEFLDSQGRPHPQAQNNPRHLVIGSRQLLDFSLEGFSRPEMAVGYIRVKALNPGGRVGGIALVLRAGERESLLLVDAVKPLRRRSIFPYLAQNTDFFTAYSLVNPHDFPVAYTVQVFSASGSLVTSTRRSLGAHEKQSELISKILAANQSGGYFVIDAEWPLSSISVIGATSGSSLVNLPLQ